MLLPYASDRPPRNPPLVVVTLVLFQFALFGVIALLLTIPGASVKVIAWYVRLSLVPGDMRWYSPFTYSFLHAGIMHLSVNMLFLWVFGSSVEDALGWKRFLALYLGAAVVTGLLQAGMAYALPGAAATTPIVGASGAISAIVGVFAVRFYRSRIRFIGLPWRVPAVALLAIVLLGEMAASLMDLLNSGVGGGDAAAHWAHVGGFILGMGWAQLTKMFQAGRREYQAADAAAEMERGSPLVAVRRWEAVLHTQPDDLQARAELGRAWAIVGDREQSLDCYTSAISGMLRRGLRQDAVARYAEMIDHYPDATLKPSDQFAIATRLEEQGEYEKSVEAFEALARAHPGVHEAQMADLRAGVLCLKRLGQPERGASKLRAFLARYPESEWRAYAEGLLKEAGIVI